MLLGLRKARAVDLFVVLNEAEIGQQVFLGNKHQIIQLPVLHIAQHSFFLLGKIGEKALVNHLHGFIKQLGDGPHNANRRWSGLPQPGGQISFTVIYSRSFFSSSAMSASLHAQGGIEVFAFRTYSSAALLSVYSADSLISRASCMISKAYFSLPADLLHSGAFVNWDS